MSSEIRHDLVIAVDTPEQIFNAPDIDPFSESELRVLGVSGLAYFIRQLQAHRRDWQHTRLIVRMPADLITPGFERRMTEAVHRYCRAKIQDNKIESHLIRVRSSIGLGILICVVVTAIIIAYLLFNGPLAGTSKAVQLVVAATISLFSWVSLWDPLEALLFNPIGFMRENFILRRIGALDILVEPVALTGSANSTVEAAAPYTAAPARHEDALRKSM